MKHKIEVKNNRSTVTLKAENGEEYAFSYRVDGVAFVDFINVVEQANSGRRAKDEEAQAKEFLKIFNALKRVFGRHFDGLMEFCEENDEELAMEEFIKLVVEFNAEEVNEELPKKQSS